VSEIPLHLHLDYVVNLETPTPQILDEVDDDIHDEPPVVEVLDEVDNSSHDEPPVDDGNAQGIVHERESKRQNTPLMHLKSITTK
jgi:hypothetical protein